MITKLIVIPEYNWFVKLFIQQNDESTDSIYEALLRINGNMQEMRNILQSNKENQGFTYTYHNYTILYIGKQSNAREFAKTFEHEKGHLIAHIAETRNLDPYSEEFQYLNQEITEKLFSVAQPFMCDNCRKHILQ